MAKRSILAKTCSLLVAVWLTEPPQAAALGVGFVERAYFRTDGSGLFSLKVDLSKSSRLIGFVKFLNKEYEGVTKLIGYNAFCATKKQFKKLPGIEGVRVQHDDAMLKFTLRFEFKSIQALNTAMRAMNRGLDPDGAITYFSLTPKLFVREDVHGIAKRLIYYQDHDNCLVRSLNLASFFKDITYTTIYTFPTAIRDYSNQRSEVAKDTKTIRVTHHLLSPEETEDSITNRIHFFTE